MKPLVLCALALGTLGRPTLASDLEHEWGDWYFYSVQGRFEEAGGEPGRLRWSFEVQAPSRRDSSDFHQLFLRPSIGYDLSPSTSIWFGYDHFFTDPGAGPHFDEDRTWQQVSYGTHAGSLPIALRTRLEERYVETGDDVGWRLRQMARITPPLNETGSVYLAASDELFINLNDTDWGAADGFGENRLFAGVGWKLGAGAKLEVGYQNQYLHREAVPDAMYHSLLAHYSMNL